MADEKRLQKEPESTDSNNALLRQLVEQLMARQPADPHNLGLSEEQRKRLSAPLDKHRYRYVACRSQDTQCLFEAHVVEARDKAKFPEGRITSFRNYRLPENFWRWVSAGGLIPDGIPVLSDGRRGLPSMNAEGFPVDELTAEFKQWRSREFWIKDLRFYVGRAITRDLCLNADTGLKTPWEESSNVAIQEGEAAE